MNATVAGLVFCAAAAAAAIAAGGQTAEPPPPQDRSGIVRYADSGATLAARWSWAVAETRRRAFRQGAWIGYSVVRPMGERSFIGSFYSDERRNHPSLGELLTGMRAEDGPIHSGHAFNRISGTMNFDDDDDAPSKTVMKEVALLFRLVAAGGEDVRELTVSNLSLRVDLEGLPLVWLGAADTSESVQFLGGILGRTSDDRLAEDLLMAVSLHDGSPEAARILREALRNSGSVPMREAAAFWLGQIGTDAALALLVDAATSDPSEAVREKVIFSISQMDREDAVDAIIGFATGHPDSDTREHAAFWLGQKASERAVGALRRMVDDDEDAEVRKSALFALTQLEDGRGIDELIRIARTHPDPRLRKDAIFWLGQSEDTRAIEALVEIVKGR